MNIYGLMIMVLIMLPNMIYSIKCKAAKNVCANKVMNLWFLYFIKQNLAKSMALAIIPTCIFLLCGITLQHVLLVISAVIFGVGHIYVTYRNVKDSGSVN